ncbi:hypothetical protein LTS07_001157 [Exophiala sideris]|uniref:Zn(2)-C6 fungal-type domain-containing protein n=1 Tax=Exophiala sideris TaxID=1016849 RepID=A0ABR0JPG4_9EURO|nr:hypothetical protein LTS07_001157 [Exophiala sideris]KAK5043672.1 hypothetical protein LTR13_000026 [Exophiala sideris]KAK5067171.1 hypothetical protein LTR69_001158 [Exophiala sideris]KAK5182504.1 hypothetical protein LTR44_004895 [Eurotiomycetes sp. CCFEE 6388]
MGGRSGTHATPKENGSALRRPKAPVACVVCKSRRIRCSGTAPCQACIALNTECIIDETLDGRRKVALTRKLDELIHHKWILEGLLICLRYSRGSALIDLLERVNADVPLRLLAAVVSADLAKAELQPEVQFRASEIRREIAPYITGVVQTEHDVLLRPATQPATSDILKYEMHSPDVNAALMGLPSTTAAPYLSPNYGDGRSPNLHGRSDGFYLGAVVDLAGGRDVAGLAQLEDDIASYRQGLGLEDMLRFLRVPQSSPVRRTSYDTNQSTDQESESGFVTNLAMNLDVHISKSYTMEHLTLQTELSPEMTPKSLKRPLSTSNIAPARAAPPTPSSTQSFTSQLPANEASSRRLSTTSSSICNRYEQSPEIDGGFHHWSELPQPARPIAMHLALPRIELNETPMSCAITSYLDLARSMLSRGTPIEEVFGPEPPMVDLLFRPRNPSDSHSACHFAAELCKRIKGMEVASRLGITVMFVHLLRWMILSSRENYQKIPEIYRPTMTQIKIPHSAEIEFCPFPELRDALCRRNREFLPALASNVRCNWPHKVESCIDQHDTTRHVVLTEDFSRHIFNPDNWTIKPGMFDTFPECRGLLKTTVLRG